MLTGYKTVMEDVNGSNEVDTIKTWSFNETLFGLAIVLCIYFLIVTKILPAIMKSRQAYRLTNLLIAYNAFQVAFSMYLVFIYLRYMFRHGLLLTRCPKGEQLKEVYNEIYPYFLAKHFDFLDTVFFVLRKKDNQVTFLHLYHHATMATWLWFYRFYYPTDHFVFVGFLNSLVHVIMYTYYGISALGPRYAKFIWWKKHLTKIQLVQFILVILNLHYQQKLSPCPIPVLFHYYCMCLIISFFVLFMLFYWRSYRQKTIKNGLNNVPTSKLSAN